VHFKTVLEDILHRNVRPGGVGEEGKISGRKGTGMDPVIKPKRCGSSVFNLNIGDGSE
jgi:hypothetical protein